jgi:hypothetical protein
MERRRVVLDSNVLVRDRNLRSADMRLLLARDVYDVWIVVPELVIIEAVGARRRAVDDALRHRAKADRELRYLGIGVPDSRTGDEAAGALRVSEYETLLRTTFRPDESEDPNLLEALVRRAIERRRPFNDQGHGFRDAIVWESVVRQALRHPTDEIILVSSDQVFGKGSRLHGDLAADLRSRSVDSNRVSLWSDLSSFVSACLREATDLQQQRVEGGLEESTSDELLNVIWDQPGTIDEMRTLVERTPIDTGGFGNAEILEVELDDPEIARIDKGSDDYVLSVECSATIRIALETWDGETGETVTRLLAIDRGLEFTLTVESETLEIVDVSLDDLGPLRYVSGEFE